MRVADFLGQQLPTFPVILRQPVFDGHDRVLLDPVFQKAHHLLAGQLLAFFAQVVGLGIFVVQFRGGRVERDSHLFARLVAGLCDGFQDHFDGFALALRAGA